MMYFLPAKIEHVLDKSMNHLSVAIYLYNYGCSAIHCYATIVVGIIFMKNPDCTLMWLAINQTTESTLTKTQKKTLRHVAI